MVYAARNVQTFSRTGLALTRTSERKQQLRRCLTAQTQPAQHLFVHPWDKQRIIATTNSGRHVLSRHYLVSIGEPQCCTGVNYQIPFLHDQQVLHVRHSFHSCGHHTQRARHLILASQVHDQHGHDALLHSQDQDHSTQQTLHSVRRTQNHGSYIQHAQHPLHHIVDQSPYSFHELEHYTAHLHCNPMHHIDHDRSQNPITHIQLAKHPMHHAPHANHQAHIHSDGKLPNSHQQSQAQKFSRNAFNTIYHNDELQLRPEQLSRALSALSQRHTAPSPAMLMGLLKACIKSNSCTQAKQVSSYLIGNNIPLKGLLGDYLVVTLAKCGAIEYALEISATLTCRTVFSWTAMISAYVERGLGHEALQLFKRMVEDSVEPNHFTFVSLLQACGTINDLQQGKKLHANAQHRGLLSNLFVGNSLISMYVKCKAIGEAEEVFSALLQRDVVSWNTMLSAYIEHGQAEKVLRLYRQLQEDGGSRDHLTLVSAIQACSILVQKDKEHHFKGYATEAMALEIGQALHAEARKKFSTSEMVVAALVVLYGKCGEVALAEYVFRVSSHRDTVIWNSLLAAYLEQGTREKALYLCARMREECVTFDEVTCIYSLQACSDLGSLAMCNELHFQVASAGCDRVHSVAATLIQTYKNCACMLDAQAFFNAISNPDFVTCTTCTAGHAGDGNSIASLHMFEHMRFDGIKPDEILFTAVLSACSHGGLVTEGLQYFQSLRLDHGMRPNLKHYGIMLDLLGRAGDFKGVDTLLNEMPMEADFTIWSSLLGACRIHGNVELAKYAFEHMVSLQPEQTFAYILMANIYVDAGLQDCAAAVDIARHKVGEATTHLTHSLLDDELYTLYA